MGEATSKWEQIFGTGGSKHMFAKRVRHLLRLQEECVLRHVKAKEERQLQQQQDRMNRRHRRSEEKALHKKAPR